METSQVAVQGIRLRLILTDLVDEAQREVLHDDKRLYDVGHDAARHQLAFKFHPLHREVVQAVHLERIHRIEELAFEIVSRHHRVDSPGMEHAAVDFPVELEALGIAVEDGIVRRLITARLIVTMVDVQTSLQSFQGAIDGNHVVVVTGIETQRVDLLHIDRKVLIVELTVFGKELKHTRQDAAREPEVLVFGEGDASQVGRDDHTLAVAQ